MVPHSVSEQKLSFIPEIFTIIMSGHKEASFMIRYSMFVQLQKVIPVGYSSWTAGVNKGEDCVFFLKWNKNIDAYFYLRRNLCSSIFNRNFKNFTPRGIVKKIIKWIPIGILATEKCFVNRGFMSNKWVKSNQQILQCDNMYRYVFTTYKKLCFFCKLLIFVYHGRG